MIKGIYLNTDNEKNSKGIQEANFIFTCIFCSFYTQGYANQRLKNVNKSGAILLSVFNGHEKTMVIKLVDRCLQAPVIEIL